MNSMIVVKTKTVKSGNLVLNIVTVLFHRAENRCFITFVMCSVYHLSRYTCPYSHHEGTWGSGYIVTQS
jgi:hypothetical protein